MRKTALLTGVAGLLLMTAPAFAQDNTAPQTPPASAMATPPAAEQPATPAAPTLTLQPGAEVKGSDGSVLGQLEGARNGASGQELTVRGADGQLRAVPVSGGVRQEGTGIAVGWTSAQFSAAPSITDSAADVAEPAAPPMPATPPVPAGPGMAPTTPPTLPPADDSGAPEPGEGQMAEPDAPGA